MAVPEHISICYLTHLHLLGCRHVPLVKRCRASGPGPDARLSTLSTLLLDGVVLAQVAAPPKPTLNRGSSDSSGNHTIEGTATARATSSACREAKRRPEAEFHLLRATRTWRLAAALAGPRRCDEVRQWVRRHRARLRRHVEVRRPSGDARRFGCIGGVAV